MKNMSPLLKFRGELERHRQHWRQDTERRETKQQKSNEKIKKTKQHTHTHTHTHTTENYMSNTPGFL